MKKILISCIAICSTISVFAQRYSTSSDFNLSIGVLDKGYTATLEYEKFTSSKTSISGNLNYMNRSQKIKNISTKAKMDSYFFDAKYRYYLTNQKNLFPYIGVGGLIGYEVFSNKDQFSGNYKIDLDNALMYGISTEAGIEYNIQRFSFIASVNPMYEFKKNKLYSPVKIGVKYYY